MDEMTREEFMRQKDEASRRIKEIYRGQRMPPYPSFVKLPNEESQKPAVLQTESSKGQTKNSLTCASSGKSAGIESSPLNIFKSLNIQQIMRSPDSLLILGLIFLLMSDKADEKLILALIFIML